jgi:ubiquinone/menaquinone biosynthesis C-methylase UbiE
MSSSAQEHNRLVVEQFTHQAKPFAEDPIHFVEESLRSLVKLSGVTASDEALDVACGTGIVSCALAKAARAVTGIDLVPAMLDEARKLQQREGLTNVRWELGDVAKLPFEENSFDAVVTRYTFHHFSEPVKVIEEMARVCRPGKCVVVADVTPDASKRARFDEMEKLRDASHNSALTLDELKALGTGVGLRFEKNDYYDLDTAVESLLAASHSAPPEQAKVREMIRKDLATDRIGVKAYSEDGELRFRFPVSIVVWRKSA